jgi:Domain of unknown function (DU1801)
MATENKTKPSVIDVEAFLATIEPESRRAETQQLLDIMGRVSGLPPVLWGSNMLGFGQYHYVYDSGREGDYFRIGLSPRKAQLSIYIISGFDGLHDKLATLGKHSIGASCLYVKKLSDVDMEVLGHIIQHGWDEMAKRYPL